MNKSHLYTTTVNNLSSLFFVCFLLFLFVPSSDLHSQEITTYYLIRHAEKDLTNKKNRNPHLTEIGQKRAAAWRDYFKEVKFDLIYSTNYYRTLETAGPTAKQHQLTIKNYDPRDLYNDSFKKETQGKTVLVVGHSNTTPALANRILGKEAYESIDEKIHGHLYIIQLYNNQVNSQLLTLE